MDWLGNLRRAPSRDQLARLCDAIAPGSRAANVRRLPGGLGAGMHRVDLTAPDGVRQRLVLRRYPPMALADDQHLPVRGWRTLRLLEELGISAPRPVWFDDEGAVFGTPAIVMTYLPGRSLVAPRDVDGWLARLAGALAQIHRARIDGLDVSFLPGPNDAQERMFTHMAKDTSFADDPLRVQVYAALRRWRPRLRRMTLVLQHDDYWAGNTLWLRNRLVAVIDWDSAALGYPGADVGYCRMDLAMLIGPEAADPFLQAYEKQAGWHVPQLFYWDLLGAAHALLDDPLRWLPGYHDLGRTDITPELMVARLHAFVRDALARSEATGNMQ
jgi:aminoglycoside phosphotransferase (APT) family kinase protein